MNILKEALGRRYRLIYRDASGRSEAAEGVIVAIDERTVTIRDDARRELTFNRSDVLDDWEVP